VATATGGTLRGPDVEVDGASFDSRTVAPGELFVALVADRDGHDFVATALRAGAGAALVSRPVGAPSTTTIEVADTATALLDLAAWARRRLTATVVGVTGSVGKTSTKDLLAAAVATGRRVTANAASFNNDQGLPVTVLGAADDTEVLVLEMGMRGFGEITRLCSVARPDVGVVTAVAPSHTERVGGIDGVALAKAELVVALPTTGTAVLNADDERVAAMAAATNAEVITFGTTAPATVRVEGLTVDALARARFTVHSPWGTVDVALAVSGEHMALNAAAALAVAGVVGVDLQAAAAALATARLSSGRMNVVAVATGGIVVDDAYNANPASMRAALAALARMDAHRRVAVLGLMGELDDPATAHTEVAAYAASLDIDIVAVGTDHYGQPGCSIADAVAAVGPIGDGVVVLVKASHAAGLEQLAADLVSVAGGVAERAR